jgi:hypothetical protein
MIVLVGRKPEKEGILDKKTPFLVGFPTKMTAKKVLPELKTQVNYDIKVLRDISDYTNDIGMLNT